jgi:hypothetical protein
MCTFWNSHVDKAGWSLICAIEMTEEPLYGLHICPPNNPLYGLHMPAQEPLYGLNICPLKNPYMGYCRKMYTICSAVLRQQRKIDVMTYFGHTARSTVYYQQDPIGRS